MTLFPRPWQKQKVENSQVIRGPILTLRAFENTCSAAASVENEMTHQ
jgi:hypothetical protein